jgi:hypothetical protein
MLLLKTYFLGSWERRGEGCIVKREREVEGR